MSTSTLFNWASILSHNLLKDLEKAVQKKDPKVTTFYFATYLLDALCTSNSFPRLNWAWTPKSPPINLYCKELWRENNYKEMYNICDHFIAQAHQLFFRTEMPRISEARRESISLIRNWYLLKHFTYIRLASITAAPNFLLKYVLDKFLLKKFSFHLFEIGQTIELIRKKVKAWQKMPVPLGPFQILNHRHARKELEDYLDYRWFPAPIQ